MSNLSEDEMANLMKTIRILDKAMQSDNPAVKTALKELIMTTVLVEGTQEANNGMLSKMCRRLDQLENYTRELHREMDHRFRSDGDPRWRGYEDFERRAQERRYSPVSGAWKWDKNV